MPRRNPPRAREDFDPDAVLQRVTDIEALLVSPGWIWLVNEANKLYGQRAFTEQVEQVVRVGGTTDAIAARTVSLTAGRMAAGAIINLPTETLADLKRKLATQQGDEQRDRAETPPLGPNVEMSR